MSDFGNFTGYLVSLSEQAQWGRSCRVTSWQHREEAPQQDGRVKAQIVRLVGTKYRDFQPSLVCKYLFRDEGISVSEEFVRRIIKSNEGERANNGLEEHHPLRRRRNRFGELIQIDGSPHRWFGEDKEPCSLLTFIDDASGKITAAGFFPTETTEGYLHLIQEHVLHYGIPLAFYSDRHSILNVG